MSGGVIKAEATGVDPCEIGGLALISAERGAVVVDVGNEFIAIFAELVDQALAPWFAVAVCGLGGVVGESVDFGQRVAACGVESAAERVVGSDGERVSESGDVPGFTRRE